MDQMCSDTIKLYYLDSIYMNIGSIYMPATVFLEEFLEDCGNPG